NISSGVAQLWLNQESPTSPSGPGVGTTCYFSSPMSAQPGNAMGVEQLLSAAMDHAGIWMYALDGNGFIKKILVSDGSCDFFIGQNWVPYFSYDGFGRGKQRTFAHE